MFARTERLLLRPGFPEDAEALHAAIRDQSISCNTVRVPNPYRLEDARAYLESFSDDRTTSFLIFERTDGAPQLVGGCGFAPRASGTVELGYWIAPDKRGRGIATEACRAVLDIARTLKVERLEAGHFIDNPASGRVLEKLGFRPTGVIEACFSLGRQRTVQTRMYALDLPSGDFPRSIAA